MIPVRGELMLLVAIPVERRHRVVQRRRRHRTGYAAFM